MKVAVVGAGNGGTAVATDLAYRGHEVTLIKTSNSIHDDNFNYLIENDGHMTLDEFGEFKSGDIAHADERHDEMIGAEGLHVCFLV